MEKQKPIPTHAGKQQISKFAEGIADRLQFRPGDSLEPIVIRLGGKIDYADLSDPSEQPPESIVVKPLSEGRVEFTIYIPTTTTPQRDRFTIAHELGHVFLHFPMVQRSHPRAEMHATRWVDTTDKVQQRAEWEANWFAAAFLMPEIQFREVWERSSREAVRLFRVSEQAASIRAQSLGLS
ncbi:MAG: ImmA/IrrE family metallo-endopeptidase [Alphaproteobacteria bacterium]|nr:ImmA/IrrE family metallo-endopeptidase [Alphaproteobacteria bacterium]